MSTESTATLISTLTSSKSSSKPFHSLVNHTSTKQHDHQRPRATYDFPAISSQQHKRPRYGSGSSELTSPAASSHSFKKLAAEDTMDDRDEKSDRRKRPRSTSPHDEAGSIFNAAGPNNDMNSNIGNNNNSSSGTSSRLPPGHHGSWPGRSASASLDTTRSREAADVKVLPSVARRPEFDPSADVRYDSQARGDGRRIGGLVGDRIGDADLRERHHNIEFREAAPSSHRMLPPPASSLETRSPSLPHRLPSLQQRASSPPPRLPSFSSLEGDAGPAHRPGPGSGQGGPHELGRNREDVGMGALYSTSPHRSMAYRPSPYGAYPMLPNRTPLMHHPSPAASTSYGNPPMIHPALAGLPGAGGGPGGKQQPSFVSKLYSMLEDPSISDLITWGPSGTVFSVANPAEFSRLVLPNWFKHSNWQSFVRQLNMYGFHKVNHSYQGNPTDEVQVWEFRHPSFRRGEIALLNDIKRKSSRQKRGGSPRGSLGGTDTRGDRSGGSPTPSPEMPLATISAGPDGIRMGMGIHHGARGDYGYGEDRIDPVGFDRRYDPRGFGHERPSYGGANVGSAGSGGGAGGYGPQGGHDEEPYGRIKAEEPSSAPSYGDSRPPVGPPLGHAAEYGREDAPHRRSDRAILDRGEALDRLEDLSERTDAIIRHASFLESQVRMLSNQLSDSRNATHQLVRDEMLQLFDRLERALSTPAPAGVDIGQRMLETFRSQISHYSRASSESKPSYLSHRYGSGDAVGASAVKRPSI
ncbi:hypothetical protein BCV70DRAFT_156964 [Testicularia cyperi]|uniref:HSF-type DNA-binding domain-containing protein n=1 Tax=Testicularia cyperi TaxID=1882483 RepID=A0A317XVM6_9BASI|nr:hypothetical protein BCV70DRAFT_156964 [Testicularia cyperi]